MLTKIDPSSRSDPRVAEAEAIVRTCVHCGFCNAACPTYRLLGSELDGPRGRIYLVKNLLEGAAAGEKTRLHLDRCLTCRSCETTCPSGVKYGRLVDIGRSLLEEKLDRPFADRSVRRILLDVLPERGRLRLAMKFARMAKPLFPGFLRRKVFPGKRAHPFPEARHRRRMLILEGCVLPLASPDTNFAAARVLDRLGISLIPMRGCCGAMELHMGKLLDAKERMRRNIDDWWPQVESGVEAIVLAASGCGLEVKEYGEILKDDPAYAEKASKISRLARDLCEVVAGEESAIFSGIGRGRKVAWHCPCTLQHGQKLDGVVESLLEKCGYRLTPVSDPHLCCGAAGTYSLLQKDISGKLLEMKLASLEAGEPEIIATANVGCQMHLASGSKYPVRHWVELLVDQP